MNRNNLKKSILICVLVLTGLPFGFGQQHEMPDTVINDLEEIVFSANRWEQNLSEVPMKIDKISPSLVRLQNPQTAADLLTASSHVFVQKSQLGGGSPMIRGFATNRVLIVVDGVRMNNAIFRSGNVQNVISLDPNAVAATEVIFGPGAVMYGSDAIGGVMDFHTLSPEYATVESNHLSAHAMTRFSSANNERTVHADFNIGLKKWSFLTSITRSLYDDLRMGSNGPEEYLRPDYATRMNDVDVVAVNNEPEFQKNSGYDQWNAMQKIGFRPNEKTEFVYGFHYSETSDYPRYDRLILKEDGVLANAEWYYGPQQWMMHNLGFKNSSTTSLYDQVKFIAGYQEFQESRHNRGFGSTRRTDRMENVLAFSLNLDFEKKFSGKLDLFYGAEFVANGVKSVASRTDISTGEVTPTSTRYPDDARWRSAAAYVNAKVTPAEHWVLNVSVRYTSVYTKAKFDNTFFDFQFSESEVKNSALSGSAGAVFNPTDGLKLYANLSTGFRAPNVDDIGKVFDSEPGNVVVPNPALAPEQAYNAEIGFTGYLGHLKIDLTGYYTFLDDAIARGVSTFNGQDSIDYDGVRSRVLSQQNISDIRVSGVQASVELHIDPFTISSSLNIQKGRESDPETGRDFSPTHVAPSFGSTHLIYRWKKVTADLYANYNGEISFDDLSLSERGDHHLYAKDKNGHPYSPSWLTINLKAGYRLNEHVTFSGGIENIFDKRYRPYSSGIAAPGRNFIVSIRAHF